MPLPVLRVALALGALIDGSVAILALFFQQLLGPLLDVPSRDPAVATFLGGELAVVALLYVAIFRDPQRLRPLLALTALDQLFAAGLPALEMARGHVAVSLKTVGPIPVSLILAIVFLLALRSGDTSAASRRGSSL